MKSKDQLWVLIAIIAILLAQALASEQKIKKGVDQKIYAKDFISSTIR